jgi:membrane-associated protein
MFTISLGRPVRVFAVGYLAEISPMLLGMDWMDPAWWLERFGDAFFWLSLIILFVECGLFFPFLPGDTLLFAMGLFISRGDIDIFPGPDLIELLLALSLFSAAAFLGNVVGYEIGRAIGPPLYERDGRILKRKYFDQTEAFFDRHGNKALVIGRFVPFVRTYITVVAGVGRMGRRRFLLWSLVGALLWVVSITLLGYFLGRTVPALGENIDLVILLILAFSVVPVAYEWWRHRRTSSPTAEDNDADGVPDRDVTGLGTEPRER